uniref:Uncharacterized protein n=1 Tax=Arundo donax TaxID=35708 RepID=A0A0A9FSG2_ARUDO
MPSCSDTVFFPKSALFQWKSLDILLRKQNLVPSQDFIAFLPFSISWLQHN